MHALASSPSEAALARTIATGEARAIATPTAKSGAASPEDLVNSLTSELAIAKAEAEAARAEANEMREELEAFGIAAVKSASGSDAKIASLEAALAAERERAERAEAEVERLHSQASTTVPPTPLSSRPSGRSSITRQSSGGSTPAQPALSPTDECETPGWLREAGGLALSDVRSAQKQRKEQEMQAAVEAAEAQARAAAEVEAAEALRLAGEEASAAAAKAHKVAAESAVAMAEAEAARTAAAASADELRARCEALEADKAALLAEVAKIAGHVNHKQKIHYLSKLKAENDDLRMQLKAARSGQTTASLQLTAATGKENGRSRLRAATS